ncbi:7161_t:CDS:2 [Ambispora leptoticha]|uniref:7161_t:CDS:1 n=1 Tax=Ambispora leptoticha TaxID=144679 RepID=A0A9N9HXD7_9GLOM|nr:7161_t:CDS:2 [Ambispora leptoticha]
MEDHKDRWRQKCQENENMSSDMFERLMREIREEEGSFVSKKGEPVDQRLYWGIHLKKQITKLKKEKIVLGEELKKVMEEDNLFWQRRKDD